MNLSPFAILQPFADKLDVALLTREDGVKDDAGTQSLLGWEHLATVQQVHGNRTIYVTDDTRRDEEADGIVCDEPFLGLAIRAADCQIFGFYDPRMEAIGVLHAGWKGLLNDAIPAFVSSMSRSFRISPSDLYVVAGPSLCTQCAEFTDPLTELKGLDPKFFHGRHADLRGIAEDQLSALGIRSDRFERHPACTKCSASTYWSYRADKEKVLEGYRNVLALRLKSEQEDETENSEEQVDFSASMARFDMSR
jgi:YfiH family protein